MKRREKRAGSDLIQQLDHTADRLANAALHLFDRQGFGATTVDEIAAAANVSRRTFFRHFPKKESVILLEQNIIHAEFRKRFENRHPGVSVLDEFIDCVPAIIHQASLDPERLKLRVKLVKSVPELASVERDADSVTVEMFASAYAKELGGRAEDRVRAVAIGAAVVAGANAALSESAAGRDALALFEAVTNSIRNWAPAAPVRTAVAILEVPSALSGEEVAKLLKGALRQSRTPSGTSRRAGRTPR